MLREKVAGLIELRKEFLKETLANAGTTIKGFLLRGSDSTNPKHQKSIDAINSLDDEAQIEFIARYPQKAFMRVIDNISGRGLAKDASRQKDALRKWIKGGGMDVRRGLKEIADDHRASNPDDQELAAFESLLATSSDDELIEYFLENQDEKGLAMLVGVMNLSEAVAEPNVIAEVESGRFDEFEKEMEIVEGLARNKIPIEDKSASDITPSEDELIEMLNVFEFRRDEPSYSARLMATMAGKKTDLELLSMICQATEYLRQMQGGALDRFKLRDFSPLELEHLIQDTEEKIQRTDNERSKSSEAIGKIADRFNVPSGVTDVFAPNVYAYQLYVQRRVLSEARLRLKQSRAVPLASDDRSQVADDIRALQKQITELEKDRDDQIRQHPQMANEINRRYRKQIDALKEKL